MECGGGPSGEDLVENDPYAVVVEHAGLEVGGQGGVGCELGFDKCFVSNVAEMLGDPAGTSVECAPVEFSRGQAPPGQAVFGQLVLQGVDEDFMWHGWESPCRGGTATFLVQ